MVAMRIRRPSRRVQIIVAAGLLFAVIAVLPWLVFGLRSGTIVTTISNAPKRHVVLVLGAGITTNNKPSLVLDERIVTAVELYRADKVKKLLMSGDNSIANYDEVSAMKNRAMELGVPDRDVILDFAGFRTLDSCVRLRKVFGQSEALIVSQGFHLPRAIHLCRWAGVDVIGVEASDIRPRSQRLKSGVREIPASLQAWFDTHVIGRNAKFLGESINVDNPPPEALRQPLDTAIAENP